MKDFFDLIRRNRMLLVLPLIVFVAALALAAYVVTRPVLGTTIYKP